MAWRGLELCVEGHILTNERLYSRVMGFIDALHNSMQMFSLLVVH